jgi:TolB-like protein/Flp pilus assembly protein TadD
MPGHPNKLVQFWQELRRRRVIQMVVVYATTAFVLIELANNVSEPLRLPEWTPRVTIIVLAVCFPVLLLLSWFFDITLQGIRKTEALEDLPRQKGYKLNTGLKSDFENSIAVLPFQDMSPNKDHEYFCDGITEEIINALTRIESLKVIARTSAFVFKNTATDIREIGQRLNVLSLLEGSIRKDGNRLRITAQLINVEDGFHLWSEVFDRELKDVFAIQEEISLAIVEKLRIKLIGNVKAEMVKQPVEDLETYNHLLLAHYLQEKGSEDSIAKAIEYYHQTIQKNPDCAEAYAGLAVSHTYLGFIKSIAPLNTFPKAKEAALRSIDLNPSLIEAHISLGLVKIFYEWDWKGAERLFQKALELRPNYAQAYQGMTFLHYALGRTEECVTAGKRGVELDPLSAVLREILGFALLRAGELKKAREHFRKALELEPIYEQARWMVGHTYILESDYASGIKEIEKAYDQSEGSPLICSGLAWAYAVSGRKKEAERLVKEMESRRNKEYIGSYLVAKVYAGLGKKDKAFHWLNKALEEHDVSLSFIRKDETLESLSSDPRFKEIIVKIGLDNY